MNKGQLVTRNIAKSGEVHNWGGFSPFQLHHNLIVNHSQSASCHIATVMPHPKKDTTYNKRTKKMNTKCQRFDKIKRAATHCTKPTLCSTFAFAPTAQSTPTANI